MPRAASQGILAAFVLGSIAIAQVETGSQTLSSLQESMSRLLASQESLADENRRLRAEMEKIPKEHQSLKSAHEDLLDQKARTLDDAALEAGINAAVDRTSTTVHSKANPATALNSPRRPEPLEPCRRSCAESR